MLEDYFDFLAEDDIRQGKRIKNSHHGVVW